MVSDRTSIRRAPERGTDDPSVLRAILDEAILCHVGYVAPDGPRVIPTLHARAGDELLLHGSPAAGFLRAARRGDQLCVTVTILDGLVLARSAFHHSANYRSAVVFGRGRRLTGEEKVGSLDAFVDKLTPARRNTLRPMTDDEVRRTEIVAVPLDEWSVKQRSGPPKDDEADYALDIWAGVIPAQITWGEPVPDPRSNPDATQPEHLGFFSP